MKALLVSTLLFISSLSCLGAEKSEIDKFLESRPTFKNLEKEDVQNQFGLYLADSAYKSIREGVTITVFVRKGEILGYEILVEGNVDTLGVTAIHEAITKAYSGYEVVSQFKGRNSCGLTLIDSKKFELAKDEAVQNLSKLLAP